MPYLIRKKIKLLYERPLVLKVDLDDDKFPRHYEVVDSANIRAIYGKVSLLVDENNCVKYVIDKDFEFVKEGKGNYLASGKVAYTRYLRLPKELVNDYGIDAGMGIEILLNEVICRGGEGIEIFPQVIESGTVDFEPRGINNESLASSEVLITTQFSEEYYRKLVSETNNAFRIRLLTATMVLIRKLFENLLIDLLRQKYGERPPNKELYYSIGGRRFHSFQTLINNFESHNEDFKAHNVGFQWDRSKSDFFKFLRDIKERGDASAHSIELIHDPEEISKLKPLINKYSDFLVRITQKVRETPS